MSLRSNAVQGVAALAAVALCAFVFWPQGDGRADLARARAEGIRRHRALELNFRTTGTDLSEKVRVCEGKRQCLPGLDAAFRAALAGDGAAMNRRRDELEPVIGLTATDHSLPETA